MWMHFIHVYDICIFIYFVSHSCTYCRILCIHSHRETVALAIENLGKASSQLSWGVNLRMGSQNTSTQIEPFSLATYNEWGSGYPTSPAWTTVGNNLGAFRVIQSWNKYSDPKPTLVRAIPFRKNYPKLGYMKGHLCFLFLLQVLIIKRMLVYSNFQWKNKYCEKIWKLKKKEFFRFLILTWLKFKNSKNDSYLIEIWISKKKCKKKGFQFCFSLKKEMIFYLWKK